MSSEPVCSVCFEDFNKSLRAKTKCPYCAISICRGCLQTYLVNDINDIPLCINNDCRRGWEREFLDGELTSAFRLKTYKAHREKVLSDREKARLPATQEAAVAYKQAKVLYTTTLEVSKQLELEIGELQQELNKVETQKYRARRIIESYGERRMTAEGTLQNEVQTNTVRAVFIKPCPAPDCKGFLSTAWKCGLCEQWTCPDCHDLKGPVKDIEHTCEEEKVATARLLAREAKSCPKCGVQICKIEGCDQMWCTACNTGFNWRTGKIASGPIHNPHYFTWLASQGITPTGGPHGPHGPHGPMNCNLQQDREIQTVLFNSRYMPPRHFPTRTGGQLEPENRYLGEVWRIMREEEDAQRGQGDDYSRIFQQLRVKYMSGEITEEEWKIQLQRKEKDANFQRAKAQVRDVFVNASRDLIRQILIEGHDKKVIQKSVEELVTYCNRSYDDVARRFNRKIKCIEIKIT
jgi:hypothetical protein